MYLCFWKQNGQNGGSHWKDRPDIAKKRELFALRVIYRIIQNQTKNSSFSNILRFISSTCQRMAIRYRLPTPSATFTSAIISQANLNKLQRIQNSLARVITNTSKYQHITPILKKLHWLPIKQRIDYKLCLLTYKTLTNQQPTYLYNSLSFPSHTVSSGVARAPQAPRPRGGPRGWRGPQGPTRGPPGKRSRRNPLARGPNKLFAGGPENRRYATDCFYKIFWFTCSFHSICPIITWQKGFLCHWSTTLEFTPSWYPKLVFFANIPFQAQNTPFQNCIPSLGSFPSPLTVYPDFDSCYSHLMPYRMTLSVRHRAIEVHYYY